MCFFVLKLKVKVQIYLDKLALPGHLKCWVVVHILLYCYLAVQAKGKRGQRGLEWSGWTFMVKQGWGKVLFNRGDLTQVRKENYIHGELCPTP